MTSTSSCGCSDDSSDYSRTQSEPKNHTVYDIANHTWQFPPLEIARMLSPKKPKPHTEPTAELLLQHQYNYAVDKPAFQNALEDVVTRLVNDATSISQSFDLHDLAAFLTRCIEACHDALDKQQDIPLRQDRWYGNFQFTVRNAPTDRSRKSARRKSLIIGAHRLSEGGNEVLCGDSSEGKPPDRLTLPVEAEGSWQVTVTHSSDDARCLFNTNKIRTFALVLAFNQDERALRFLIFHHGGLTASEPCDITTPGGLREIARLFLVLTSWSTPGDAGFVPSCTDTMCAFPADRLGKDYALAVSDGVLSWSLRLRGRMTLVSRLRLLQGSSVEGGKVSHDAQHSEVKYVQPIEIIHSDNSPTLPEVVVMKTSWPDTSRRGKEAAMYRASSGLFGTIPHICSYEGVGEHRQVISNILFLPRDGDIAKYHWPIFSSDPPEKPDLRTLWFTICGVEGQSLVEATSPRQLSRAWVHFVLGWLSTYLSGYMQGDVSIGNVFMTTTPVERKAFEIPEEFLAHLSSLEDESLVAEIRGLCKRVEQLVAELGISDGCIGFIADGDLAMTWEDCFSEENRWNKWGTPEFMSRGLFDRVATEQGYLRSPVDDLESCFWVAFWSVVFNRGHEQSFSRYECLIRERLANAMKDAAGGQLGYAALGSHCSDIMKRFNPVLDAWWKRVRDNGGYRNPGVQVVPRSVGREYYLSHFHLFALRGVVDILEVISGYWDGEIGWESWTAPSPAAVC